MKIITGMHRSGTSLVAQLFYQAGADMGSLSTFYPADRWNPRGYYEQTDIHKINMPLVNGIWWKLSYFWLPSTNIILRRARKYEDQIRQIGTNYRNKIVKENRFCLTLPAWQHYGVNIERILLCIRSPGQVLGSIQKRNHTTKKHAYYLWKVHNQRILEYATTIPLWIIDYNNLLNPEYFEKELTSALSFLGVDFSRDTIVDMYRKVVYRDLNHHIARQESYPDDVQELWETLKNIHKNQFVEKKSE